MTKVTSDLADLGQVDWDLLRSRDFKGDTDDLGKKERYHAEALIWQHLPVAALIAICSSTEEMQLKVRTYLDERGMTLTSMMRRDWYFK